MRRVRFPPSPTGSLHVGNALTAAANRAFGDWLLLRIDDTDAARNVEGGEEAILRDLEWLRIGWEEGPFCRASARTSIAQRPSGLAAHGSTTGSPSRRSRPCQTRSSPRALRLALTGRERGPELWTVIHTLPRAEALRRVDACL